MRIQVTQSRRVLDTEPAVHLTLWGTCAHFSDIQFEVCHLEFFYGNKCFNLFLKAVVFFFFLPDPKMNCITKALEALF